MPDLDPPPIVLPMQPGRFPLLKLTRMKERKFRWTNLVTIILITYKFDKYIPNFQEFIKRKIIDFAFSSSIAVITFFFAFFRNVYSVLCIQLT